MHEIITIQLGQRANYLATHFWNAQESYFTYSATDESFIDHDVHFRPGLGIEGEETFTPRTLIYDLKGGFGSLRKFNALYDIQDVTDASQALWDGSTQTQRQPPVSQNEYQKSLDEGNPIPQLTAETVRYWSDFNRVYYHPKSIVQLNDYELNSQVMPFENWSAGEELFSTFDREVDVLDRDLRPFAEECDQLACLQVFTGADDAWGGFAAMYVDKLRDEFGKTSIWNWGLENTFNVAQHKKLRKQTNIARSINAMALQASAYVRLACPPPKIPSYLKLEPSSEWYESAVLAIAVESMTLPSRVKAIGGRRGLLSDFEAVLNVQGNQSLFELRSVIDNGTRKAKYQLANGHANGNGPDVLTSANEDGIDCTPHDEESFANPERVFAQVGVARGKGWGEEKLQREPTVSEEWERRRRRVEAEPIIERYHSRVEFPVVDSFPRDMVQVHGATASLSLIASLQSTSRTRDRLRRLQSSIRNSLDSEEKEAISNGLWEIGEQYRDRDTMDDSGELDEDEDD